MKVLAAADENSRPERGCVVTVGAFDGVHLGHQELVHEVRRRAQEQGCASAVVTFDRHPAAIVRPQSAPKLLTDLDQKLELLAATGIDYTLVLRFDEERSKESAEGFVEDVLINRLQAREIVIGHDFHFGRGRRGNAELLRTMGAELGFVVDELSPVGRDGEIISSTMVRRLLLEAAVDQAARLLGRPYELRGVVVMGDGRGRELGCPTANINVAVDVLVPADGVYAGEYIFPDGRAHPAAISVGTRPMFYAEGVQSVEAHLIDFDGDLYGQHAGVRFLHRLRGQERFDSVEALVVQMQADVVSARHLLAS